MSLRLPRNWNFNQKKDMSKIVRSQSMMAVDPAGSCNWSYSLQPPERPLKTGWLKKQRSIVKNWQQRYFVLKGQHLSYYKDEDDSKLQGVIRLSGSTIKEVAGTSDEGGRFIFEVIPGISRDQNRTGQDSYLLMANSQSEMEDWVKLLRRVAGSPLGVVFGQQLVETMVYEQRFGQHQVPILVEKCAEFIRKHGLNEEGIFRLPGQDNLVKQLRDAFDAGERPSFDRETDVHTVASLFKLYLRELPEPVIPWTQYEDFLLCGQLLAADETKGHQQLMKQLSLLPQDNYKLLSYICRFLYEIQQNASSNKMSVENLATVFGVNLIRPKVEDPATIMRGTHHIQKVMTVMISDHITLFPVSKDVVPSLPLQKNDSKKASVPRSSVGWGAVERPLSSRGNRTQWQTFLRKDDLWEELKREIEIREKKGYEERINEKENYEVWAKVVRLNEEIEKEKNKSADLERKLQDIECSRDDTENKNKLLEQEILDSMKSMK
ncbi:rho GTPase-activating protein 25 [Sphaerodactylus townsendi]|uniref:rho GTPase-activating protein 25 n=1 Tax=Sphaerodactylus townsendi TaxID=933632 RepID=UPI0020266E1E|nr:rho GTPase-activating protein 25 [Sphaerodactylus townsendi]